VNTVPKAGAACSWLMLVHALDGCEALNESAIYKYSSATIPKLNALIGQCRNRAQARMEVFRRILFNTLVWCLKSNHQIMVLAARATDAKMVSALLCHTNGLGSSL